MSHLPCQHLSLLKKLKLILKILSNFAERYFFYPENERYEWLLNKSGLPYEDIIQKWNCLGPFLSVLRGR